MKTYEDLITNSNQVIEGLNFIVPSQWWRSFLAKNQNIKSLRQMRLPSSSPLDCLYEAGIIDQEPSQLHDSYINIIKGAKESLISMKKQLKQSQMVQNNENIRKRNKVSDIWLQQTHKQQLEDIELLLYSPNVKQDMVQLFQLSDESWVIIAPQLYHLIWTKERQGHKTRKQNKLTVIPLVMRKQNIQNFDKKITFHNQKSIEIYFQNFSGFSFIFKGFIDSDICLKELVDYFDFGLFRLVGGLMNTKDLQQSDKIFQISKSSKFFYEFQHEHVNESLEWVKFSQIKNTLLVGSQIQHLIVFKASYPKKKQMQCQDQQALQNLDKTRKIRKEEIFDCLNENAMGSSMNPIIVQLNQEATVERSDTHSSTQQQTPFQERQKRSGTRVQNLQASSEANRITYPIWNYREQTEHLYKYGQIKIALPKVYQPYSEQPFIVLKDDGKKTILPKLCNEIVFNEQEQLIQEQNVQPEADLKDQAPSQWVKRQLQILAFQILGIKISDTMIDAEKVQQLDLIKSNSEYQSKTCKNDFDCEESRQF